jgi:hypothetical protein
VGGVKLKLKLNSDQLKLELGLSLAIRILELWAGVSNIKNRGKGIRGHDLCFTHVITITNNCSRVRNTNLLCILAITILNQYFMAS